MRFTLMAFLLLAVSSATGQERAARVEDFSWLAGCWERVQGERVTLEQWMKPAGSTMLGMSRTVEADSTLEFEFVIIAEGEDGAIYYMAHPSGQGAASFRLTDRGERNAVFENPDHDFPQRVIYRLKDDGILYARIEGIQNGTSRGVDFRMNKRMCDE